MENPSPHKAKATELELILDRWEQRYEWRLLSRTVPRSLIAALLLSLVIGAVGYWRFRLAAEQLALIAAGLCALGGILNVLYTLVFPRSLAEKARYFDIEFGLRERVSTAFELMHGRIKTHPEIESRQIADALAHARAIDPSARITMDFRPREFGVLAILLLAMIGMLLLPAIAGEDFLPDPPSAAVEAAKEDLREIIETAAKDTNLEDVDRQQLLEALEIAHAVHLLRPFRGGGGGEIVSRPKCYAFDTGFVAFERGWSRIRADDRGVLWEHLVLDSLRFRHLDDDIFYWRDKSGREVDFVVRREDGRLDAFECKVNADEVTKTAVEALRRRYPLGRNYVVVPAVGEPYSMRRGEWQFTVCGTRHLPVNREGPTHRNLDSRP